MFKWRIVLICLLSCSPFAFSGPVKLSPPIAQKIFSFTLYNYDNLIADYYEDNQPYLLQLAHLISQATGQSKKDCFFFLKEDQQLANIPVPIHFMLRVNQVCKNETGYYFVD
eukprot:COSAG01_NODE_9_length_43729_cov_66.133463_19_plen_112_part_00